MSLYASWDVSLLHVQPWLERPELGEAVQLPAGKVLYEEQRKHRYFYLLRTGYVQATMLRSNGRILLLEMFGPGTMFGEGAAFDGGPRFVTCTASTRVELVRYDPRKIEPLLAVDPRLSLALIKLMSAKQRLLARKVAGLSSGTPQERLSELLLRVAQAEQRQRPADALQVHLTHEQLGAMTGLSRVTVTRTLAGLARVGAVRTLAGSVQLLEPQALASRAAP